MRPTLLRPALLAASLLIVACGSTTPTSSGLGAASAAPTVPTPTVTAVPATPMATSLAGTGAVAIPLPGDTFPIDLAYAFDSLWLAAHHQDEVYRIDPSTMEITARIQVGGGPGWFAVTEGAIWVTNQLGRGMTRIDPDANTEVTRVGMWPTCGSPVVALGKIWQMACDAHQLMRIDPVANTVTDFTVTDWQWPAFVDGQIVMAGATGLGRVDPETGRVTSIPGPGGFLMGYDEDTMWLSDQAVVRRVRPSDGTVVATIPVTYGGMVRPFGDHAWMIQESTAAMRVDLATSEITKTIPILYGPVVGIEAAGYLWVTTIDGNRLWRIDL
jgi:streptogramin lyase